MCKIEGCQLPNFHHNPLVSPVIKFHGRVLKTFDALPENGKVIAVAKRVAIVVVSPLAYLVLGLTALLGLALDRYFVKGHKKSEDVDGLEEEEVIQDDDPVPLLGNNKFFNVFEGRAAFDQIPELEGWDGTLDVTQMTASLMKSEGENKVYVLFRILVPSIDIETRLPNGRTRLEMGVLHWNTQSETIEGIYGTESQVVLCVGNAVDSGSMLEDVIFDRVKRLMNGEYVGYAKRYPRVALMKPDNHDEFRPDDAYLSGEDLESYMDQDTLYYEVAQGNVGGLNKIHLVEP